MTTSTPFFIHWADSIQKTDDRVQLNITIDPNKMVALKHHVFGGLCLFPFAYTTELLVQTAAHCADVDTPFPLYIEKVEQLRGIAIPFGKTQSLSVECTKNATGQFDLRLTMDLTNKNGKVIRKDCVVATATIDVQSQHASTHHTNKPKALNPLQLPQSLYYQTFHPTHGPLFQTITGDIYLDDELEGIAGKFNLAQLEHWQSIQPGLRFWLSPLAFDSVLQLSVLNCIQIESTTKPQFHAKLPVRMEGAYFPTPFVADTDYTVRGFVNKVDDKDQQSRFCVAKDNGEQVAWLSNVTLRRAPHKHFEARNLLEDFEHYRQEEVIL
ncbi:hypothetical protein HC752_06560 [Vibrio sp. S9_S30]|uniref:polyketide synthase dehydratase domain-containing protein n=1 Tax=Vibrio sp. S9_S30 TaxID=2720226 RepID=UPI00168092CB|nr:polyketide synthase dehydratase domain-containing protein [Vibrio sp. S9_S30]MBD1556594.1 hypothetical protein [Vibrio sp. S9_S30]